MYNRIVVDIDGILCENGSYLDYSKAIPIESNIKSLNSYKGNIILHTSRLYEDEEITRKWLEENNVPFDTLLMEKPKSDLYIDDKATRFIPHTEEIEDNRKELVICVSGGMDSAIAYEYAIREKGYSKSDILCINFDIGHPYGDKEKLALEKANFEYTTIKVDLCNSELHTMPDKENYIIPGRNMTFASIGASFGKRVWIAGVREEDHYLMYDKNTPFFDIASMATTQAIGKTTIIESPFSNMSKSDTINWAIEHGVPYPTLENTTSCYDPIKNRCGTCCLCFKRYIAGRVAGFIEDFEDNPETSEEADRLLQSYLVAAKEKNFTHYHRDRILETAQYLSSSSIKKVKVVADNILDALEITTKEIFSNIHSNNIWGSPESVSGPGSEIKSTEYIKSAIIKLIAENDIKTFMDAPCGDNNWLNPSELDVEKYIGYDIVDVLIKDKNYKGDNINFEIKNLESDKLEKVDLILCRECLQHLSFSSIYNVLNNFRASGSKYLLTTSHTGGENRDIKNGDYFQIDLEAEPFNFPKPILVIEEQDINGINRNKGKTLCLWEL